MATKEYEPSTERKPSAPQAFKLMYLLCEDKGIEAPQNRKEASDLIEQLSEQA